MRPPRMTRDIDIVVELGETDVETVVRLFHQDFYIDQDMVRQAIREKGMFNIIHNAFVIKIDFVVRKETAYRQEEFSRRRTMVLDGQQVSLVAPEDLILSKLEWAKDSRSQVQLNDVRNLLRSIKELDQPYLAHWASRLGVKELYEELKG